MLRTVTATVLCLSVLPRTGLAQDDFEGDVHALLEFAKMEAVVSSLSEAFTTQVSPLTGALATDDLVQLEAVVAEEFSFEKVHEDVVKFLMDSGDPETVSELLRWLPSGATGELAQVQEEYEPAQSLEEYALGLQTSPPAQTRVMVIAEWASVQGAADFYVLLEESQRAAAHEVASALVPDAPAFEWSSEAELEERLQGAFNVSLVSFLQRLEPASDDLIRAATEEYASDSGQWFVEQYTLSLISAIEQAGARVSSRVSG